jgi:glycosyltransferase involved in cell wall biosynthesis
MSDAQSIVINHTARPLPASPATVVVDVPTLSQWVKRGTIVKHLFRYRTARIVTSHIEVLYRPFIVSLLARLLSIGPCQIVDIDGHVTPITPRLLWSLLVSMVRAFSNIGRLIERSEREAQALSEAPKQPVVDLTATPVYLRTDLVFGVISGGSVGHIAGVLNHLDQFCGSPLFLTTDYIPTVRPDIESYRIWPDPVYREFPELQPLVFSEKLSAYADSQLRGRDVAFVYQRYSLNNYAGMHLAKKLSVPLVLEYNGSEVWVSRNWGRGLRYEAIAQQLELANLRGADVVVVVSQPIQDELAARGIDRRKILVNPNGVDAETYRPESDGSEVRKRYGLDGKTVIGFIGTFGRWHGAEVLAAAFGRLLQRYPTYRTSVRLLMIGDGVTMPEVKANLARYEVGDVSVLTGLVPQAQGPAHLAACDILVASHVPNPDGTPFFGSPTKLFEYMAMGKGIVASDLDQIGEVLEHDRTAWLVKPGDEEALAAGLKALVDDEALRLRLGAAARRDVMAKYTWREHTKRIIDKLSESATHQPVKQAVLSR